MNSVKQLFVFLASSLILISCNKQSGNNAVGGVSSGTMSAKVEGTVWNSGPAIQASKSGNVLKLSGNGGGKIISIEVKNYSTNTDTYLINIDNPGNSATYTDNTGVSVIYEAGALVNSSSGMLKINSDAGGVIKGTFSFEGYIKGTTNKKSITDGLFDIKYN